MAECDGNESIVGECQCMCPRAEIITREKNRRLSIFEILTGTEKDRLPKADFEKCVKEFSRSAAGCEMNLSIVRPAKVLLRCVKYLIDDILDHEKHGKSWIEIYEFVSDRLRAIRQDMVVQRLGTYESIEILKKAVRFHIVVMEECKFDFHFDRASCLDQLHACIMPLLSHIRTTNLTIDREFDLYHILLNMKSTEIVFESVRNILHDSLFSKNLSKQDKIMKIASALILSNYQRLFKIFEQLPYIASCCLILSLNELRIKLLKTITKAFSTKNLSLPLSAVAEWLKFDSARGAEDFCNDIGLKTENGGVIFANRAIIDNSKISRLKCGDDWRLIGIKKFKSVKEYVDEGDRF